MIDVTGRHPSTVHMLRQLVPNESLPDDQHAIAAGIYDLACRFTLQVKDSPELTAGLRKLLEAKDCVVRASLDLDPVDYRDR